MVDRLKIAAFLYCIDRVRDGPYFLILQRIKELGGFWQPVTGSVETNETPIQAVRREVTEETGLDTFDIIHGPVYDFCFKKQGTRFREYVFGVRSTRQDLTLSSEHTDFTWLPYDQVLAFLHWDSNKEGLRRLYRFLLHDPTSGKTNL